MNSNSLLVDTNNNSDTLIIAFSGHALKFGQVPVFEFYNFLGKHFPQYNKHFYIDIKLKHFHYGIDGISDSVESTVAYLEDKIKGYKKVICMGVSSGGYAAILFGSLLDVSTVIAFIPQTILRGEGLDDDYRDLNKYVNSETKYHIYGDPNVKWHLDCHHISHCENIGGFPNVTVYKVPDCVEMSKLKRSGQLFEIIRMALGKV